MPDTVTVTGSGVASAPADRAMVRLTTRAQDTDPGRALSRAGDVARAVVSAARTTGLPPEACATTGTTLTPLHDPQDWRVVTGHEATQSLRLTVDLPVLGQLLGEVVAHASAGVVIESVALEVAGASALADQARERAWVDARRKAAQLARWSGRELGRVLSVAEGSSAPGVPVHAGHPRALAAGDPSFEPGSHDVSVSVTAVFELL